MWGRKYLDALTLCDEPWCFCQYSARNARQMPSPQDYLMLHSIRTSGLQLLLLWCSGYRIIANSLAHHPFQPCHDSLIDLFVMLPRFIDGSQGIQKEFLSTLLWWAINTNTLHKRLIALRTTNNICVCLQNYWKLMQESVGVKWNHMRITLWPLGLINYKNCTWLGRVSL